LSNVAPPLRVKTKKPIFHDLAVSWSVDGLVQPDLHGTAFTKLLTPGSHRILATVSDTTHMVKKDPEGLLIDTASWQVTVTSILAAGPQATAGKGFPLFLGADGKGFWARLAGTGSTRLRLTAADGSLAEDRILPEGRSGSVRIAWNRVLAPGWYLAELEQGGLKASRRFIVRP